MASHLVEKKGYSKELLSFDKDFLWVIKLLIAFLFVVHSVSYCKAASLLFLFIVIVIAVQVQTQ